MILLDEVEKAHPDVFDILLQVLDDGRLTDGQGRTVDFRNTLLILTSNLGSMALMNPDLDQQQREDAVMAVVRSAFKPEFLNRLDDVVFFGSLGADELASIVDIQIGQLARRLAARRLTLEVTPAAREWLALGGFDPLYGARPLRRLIQSTIGDRLAKELLAGRILDGDAVVVDVDADPVGRSPGDRSTSRFPQPGPRGLRRRIASGLGGFTPPGPRGLWRRITSDLGGFTPRGPG